MKKIFKIFKYLLLAILALVIFFCALNYRADVPVAALKAKYAAAESQFMDLEGMAVHYRDEGNPADKTPIVLLHGTAASLLTWNGWTDALKTEHRIIRLDLPGYGLTGPSPAQDYSMNFYCRFLHDFLGKLGVNRFYLAGNSLGGKIAWEYALAYPADIKKLILIDAAGYPLSRGKPLPIRLASTPVLKNILLYVTPKFLVEKSLKEVYVDDCKVTEQLVEQYYDMACREGNRSAFVVRAGMVDDDDYLKINHIQTPTLILWGEADVWIPVENAYKFEKDMPNNRVVIFKNLGHIPQEENPSETIKEVLVFVK
ncbi:MAG: alpha/beta hydrolase [Deltaproteobacteria bacterium RBG_16_54_11]|jgi:pimeloyl-ACP methyl ester carboxylesterase|nr:MAG: alpha/beta hydrolase [Deltaproteobacteria bacterium RBG_16_54_11]